MRIPLKHSLYADLSVLLVSGLLYGIPAYVDRWFFYDLEWSLSNHMLMTVHGIAAIIFIYIFGYFTRCHVQVHLRSGRHLLSGLIMLGVLALISVTGFSLYYLGSEVIRLWTSDIHCLLGVVVPLALLAHRYHDVLKRLQVRPPTVPTR